MMQKVDVKRHTNSNHQRIKSTNDEKKSARLQVHSSERPKKLKNKDTSLGIPAEYEDGQNNEIKIRFVGE